MKYYKFLHNGKSGIEGENPWTLPVENPVGSWTPGGWTELSDFEETYNYGRPMKGYLLCRPFDLTRWCNANTLYEAQPNWEVYKHTQQGLLTWSARLIRRVENWNAKTARLFAVWRGREALKSLRHPDPRLVEALNMAERYAKEEATFHELALAYHGAEKAATGFAEGMDGIPGAVWGNQFGEDWPYDRAMWAATPDDFWGVFWAAWRYPAPPMKMQYKKLLELLGEEMWEPAFL